MSLDTDFLRQREEQKVCSIYIYTRKHTHKHTHAHTHTHTQTHTNTHGNESCKGRLGSARAHTHAHTHTHTHRTTRTGQKTSKWGSGKARRTWQNVSPAASQAP